MLSPSEASSLLRLTRQAVVEAVTRNQVLDDIPRTGIFGERRSVFVTLHVRGRLRGCIGVIDPEEFLGEGIVRCAASAALQDTRFTPLLAEELPNVSIEVSLLSSPVLVGPESILIGTHGLLISRGTRRGLLLPQVALEHRLTLQEFLEETCRKAELDPNDWREPDARIYAFTCEVLSEAYLQG